VSNERSKCPSCGVGPWNVKSRADQRSSLRKKLREAEERHATERNALREVIRSVEWVESDGEGDYCPRCSQWKRKGHASDCAIAKALGAEA
jgi:hypothetical protein